jgi:hypothetical protein
MYIPFELTVSNAICSGSLWQLTSYILLGGLSEYGSNENDPKWNPRGILASSSEPAEPSPFKPKTSWALARACSGLGLGFRFQKPEPEAQARALCRDRRNRHRATGKTYRFCQLCRILTGQIMVYLGSTKDLWLTFGGQSQKLPRCGLSGHLSQKRYVVHLARNQQR